MNPPCPYAVKPVCKKITFVIELTHCPPLEARRTYRSMICPAFIQYGTLAANGLSLLR